MRKLIVAIVLAVVACSPKVENRTSKTTHVTNIVIPEDASKKNVDTLIRPRPRFLKQSSIGAKVGPDGMVVSEVTTFHRGETVYLSLWLDESPVGLKTGAKWFDPHEKQIDFQEHAMNGAKLATFALDTKKLAPGKYRVDGYWGGNLAAQKSFEITK